MIAMIQPLPAGNALRILLQPPPSAESWRLLRKSSDSFSGYDDTDALLIYSGSDERCITDIGGLPNSLPVVYRAYYWTGDTWLASASAEAIPLATFTDLSADVPTLVRNRIDLGLQAYVERGLLSHSSGHIPVLSAAPRLEGIKFPLVTVHLASDSPSERYVGDVAGPDVFDVDAGEWRSSSGWLSRVQLTIVAWSLNADERALLRAALKAIVIANQLVFSEAGMVGVDISQADIEDFETYDSPIYQSKCDFSCLAPSAVESRYAPIGDVVSGPSP